MESLAERFKINSTVAVPDNTASDVPNMRLGWVNHALAVNGFELLLTQAAGLEPHSSHITSLTDRIAELSIEKQDLLKQIGHDNRAWEDVFNAEGFFDAASRLGNNIYKIGVEGTSMLSQGFSYSAVPVGMTLGTGGVGIIAAISTVAAKEAGNGFLMAMKKCEVDLTNPESIRTALSDPQIMHEARILAAEYGIVWGGVNAATNVMGPVVGQVAQRFTQNGLQPIKAMTIEYGGKGIVNGTGYTAAVSSTAAVSGGDFKKLTPARVPSEIVCPVEKLEPLGDFTNPQVMVRQVELSSAQKLPALRRQPVQP